MKFLRRGSRFSEKETSSALIKALRYNQLFLVRLLIEQGADAPTMNDALKWASENGHLSVVERLLEKGANIHAGYDAALIVAAGAGHLSVVERLLEKGADIHADHDAALIVAAGAGHLSVVERL